LGEDPIGFSSGDFNWYRYVGNSPTNYIDPSGFTPNKDKMYICSSSNYWRDTFHTFLCSGGECAGLYPNPRFFETGYSGETRNDTGEFDNYNNDGYCKELDTGAPSCDKDKFRICMNEFTHSPISTRPFGATDSRYPYNVATHNCRTTAGYIAIKYQILSGCY